LVVVLDSLDDLTPAEVRQLATWSRPRRPPHMGAGTVAGRQ